MVSSRESQGLAQVVLVAADDGGLRDALAFLLQVEGYSVRVVRSAQAVLDMGEGDRPDCIVVDDAPGAPALSIVGELRGAGFLAAALILSGRSNRALSVAAAVLGAHVVEKPLVPDQFISAIRSALSE